MLLHQYTMTADYISTTGRRWAGFLALLLVTTTAPAASRLADAVDLRGDARAAARTGAPILVFFSMDRCSYCETVEDLYLEPMVRRGQYAGRLVVRVVHTSRRTPMVDFAGRETTHAAFAREARATFTPTIRLFDAEGRNLVEPLVGYTSPDYYAGYLEAAIERAQDALSHTAPRACAQGVPRC